MSMCPCDKCTTFIDSDEDPDCFVEELTGYLGRDWVICENCRETLLDEDNRFIEPAEAS